MLSLSLDNQHSIVLDSAIYGSGGYCGQQVQITNLNNGQTVTVTVADECPTCDNAESIDLSVAAFQALDDLSVGTFPSKPYFTPYRLNHSRFSQLPGPLYKFTASCVYLAGLDPVGVWYYLDDTPRWHTRPRHSHTFHWQIPRSFFPSC